jgi:hypothetical protein
MLNPAWVEHEAEAFWAQTGEDVRPPLEFAIGLALPLAVVRLPRLRPESIDAWLARHGARLRLGGETGQLHGCLIVSDGVGAIFVSGSDPPAEQQFTLAHELAHYLLDYQRPRQRALSRLGPTILPVLNGLRPPDDDERLLAVFRGVPLGEYVDLFDYEDLATLVHERDADRLAIELIAPGEAALPLAAATARLPASDREGALIAELVSRFGLPEAIAVGYAKRLLAHLGLDRRLPAWLASRTTR